MRDVVKANITIELLCLLNLIRCQLMLRSQFFIHFSVCAFFGLYLQLLVDFFYFFALKKKQMKHKRENESTMTKKRKVEPNTKVTTWRNKRPKTIFPTWLVRDYILYYKWCKKKIRKWSKADILHQQVTKVKTDYYDDEPTNKYWILNYHPSTQVEIDCFNSTFISREYDVVANSKQFWLSSEGTLSQDTASLFCLTAPYRWSAERAYDTLYIELDEKRYMTRIAQKQIAIFQYKLPKVLLDYIVLFAIDHLEEDNKMDPDDE